MVEAPSGPSSLDAPPPLLDTDDLHRWRAEMDERLRRRDGWLALDGLHWLSEGTHTVGSAAACDVRLPPSSPDLLATLEVRGEQVFFRPAGLAATVEGAPGEGEPLRPDTVSDPHYLRLGEITMVLIERGARRGIRVWDNARVDRLRFPGRLWFAPQVAAAVPARFETAPTGRTIRVPDILGGVSDEPLVGIASFAYQGQTARLAALPEDEGRLWFIFADATNGETSYPGGRFLVAEAPRQGRTVLDFNRAYNPPCAFTPFATCPLPPEGNRLAFPIEVGERFRPLGISQP